MTLVVGFKRLVKWVSVFLFILAILISGLAGWVYTTESGLVWGLKQAEAYIPESLSFTGVSGTLDSSLFVTQFVWQGEDVRLVANNIQLKCRITALLDKQVDCLKVDAGSLLITITEVESDIPSEEVDVLASPLSDYLPDIELPIDIVVAELHLKKLSIADQQGVTITEIFALEKIAINKINWPSAVDAPGLYKKARQQVEFSKLEFFFEGYQLTASGHFDPRKKWPYQISADLSGEDLDAHLNSSGEVYDGSQFDLTGRLPLLGESSGFWHWRDRLTIVDSKILLREQSLLVAEETIVIEPSSLDLNLAWPQVDANFNLTGDWRNLKSLNVNGQLNSANLIDWSESTSLKLSFDSSLTAEQIESILQLPDSVSVDLTEAEAPVPITFDLQANVHGSQLSVFTENVSMPGVDASFNLSGEINGISLANIRSEGRLKIAQLKPLPQSSIKGLQVEWNFEQSANAWELTSQGKVKHANLSDWQFELLNWDIKLDDQWRAELNADKLEFASQNFSAVKVSLLGQANEHQISGLLNNQNQDRVTFSLDGRLVNFIENNNLPVGYLVKRLNAQLPLSTTKAPLSLELQDLSLTPERQQVKRFCFRHQGQICGRGELANQQWSGELRFDQFSLRTITNLISSLGEEVAFNLDGELNGEVKGTGDFDQLSAMSVDLAVPVLQLEAEFIDLQMESFTLKSTKQQGYHLIGQWQAQHLKFMNPQWHSNIESLLGQTEIEISPNYDIRLHLQQNELAWFLRPATNEEQVEEEIDAAKAILLIPQLDLNASLSSFKAANNSLKRIALTESKLSSELNIKLPGADFINTTFQSDWPIEPDSQFESQIDLNIAETDWLKHWQSRIDQLKGSWVHKLSLKGSLNNPQIDGEGEIKIEQLVVEEMGLNIENSFLAINNQNKQASISGKLKNQKGELNVIGQADFSQSPTGNLKLTGEKIALLATDENSVVVSPQIDAQYRNNHVEVTGNVRIEEAKITINEIPTQAIDVSTDQVLVNQPEKMREVPLTYLIDLRIEASNAVTFSGFGLSSELLGKLRAVAQTGKSMTLNGDLLLKNGQFEAYRQVLTIEEGQLLFLGPADNPGIQFRASRKIDEIKVGVIADGSLAKPTLTLFSEPAMAEENILALLLTGRSIESLSQSEGNALANAAIGLGVDQANKLAEKIAKELGIKNIQITSKSAADSTRVDIGTQISDDLLVGYGTTIDSNNQLNTGWIIEYRLSPSISFEAISGEEVSASVTYKKQFSGAPEKLANEPVDVKEQSEANQEPER